MPSDGVEYLGQALTNLDVRPLLAGYLIPATDGLSAFRRAVHSASQTWGGIRELVVPVTEQGDIADEWIDYLHVDPPQYLLDYAELSQAAASRVMEQTRSE